MREYSPQLASMLGRLYSHVPIELERAFAYAVTHGGLEELEFERPEGQSYNPRPARAVQIVIDDGRCVDRDALEACLFASVGSIDAHAASLRVRTIFDVACTPLPALYPMLSADIRTTNGREHECVLGAIIALGLHLDAIRHRHRGTDQSEHAWSRAIDVTEIAAALADRCAPGLSLRFRAWLDRARRRHPAAHPGTSPVPSA